MKTRLSLQFHFNVKSQEKVFQTFESLKKDCPAELILNHIEKYWKDPDIHVLSAEAMINEENISDILLRSLQICDIFAHHWLMEMPNINDKQIIMEGIANSNCHIRHKDVGVAWIRFSLKLE